MTRHLIVMTPLDVLYAVRGLIDSPFNWFKGGLCRNSEDRKVSLTHPHACKFSLDGAFFRVQYITKAECGPAYEKVKQLLYKGGPIPLASFNDAEGTTHTAVLNLLDKAIISFNGVPPARGEEQ